MTDLPGSKKPSGAQNRKRRKQEAQAAAERERERVGLNGEWLTLLDKLGPPPLDAVANSEWANNMAAGMAYIIARDEQIPLEERFKRTAELIDRIGYTHARAVTAKRVREVKESAGIPAVKDRHADGVVPVGAGDAIRAGRSARDSGAVRGPVHRLPAQGDSGGAPPSGGAVGSDDKPVH